jgi:hypothetical protein
MEIEKRRSEEKKVFPGLNITHSQAQAWLEVDCFLDSICSAYLLCQAFSCYNGSI